jgi:hypothetical protein
MVRRLRSRRRISRCTIGAGQGGPDGPAGGQALDLGGGPVRHDLALADQDDPVGVGARLFQVVRREDDRPAQGGVIADGLPEAAPALHIHSLGRLVEDEQLRVRNQRHGAASGLCAIQGAAV